MEAIGAKVEKQLPEVNRDREAYFNLAIDAYDFIKGFLRRASYAIMFLSRV